jgi:hypothetical protein
LRQVWTNAAASTRADWGIVPADERWSAINRLVRNEWSEVAAREGGELRLRLGQRGEGFDVPPIAGNSTPRSAEDRKVRRGSFVDTAPSPREPSLMADLAIGAVVTLAIAVGALAIWRVPHWQEQSWRDRGITSEEKLAELVVQARTGMIQAFGGLALIATLALSAYQVSEARRSTNENLRLADKNLRLAQQGQVSERFARAIEELGATSANGDPAIDVRTGALFLLRRIGLDATLHAEPAYRVVAAYIRNHYKEPDIPTDGCKAFNAPASDVSTALVFILPKLADYLLPKDPSGRKLGKMTGLRGATMRGLALDNLVLTDFDLTGIKLPYANLGNLDARNSILRSARFTRACLQRAKFQGADISGADFSGACLEGADFSDVTVSLFTKFDNARLHGATFDPGILGTTLSENLLRDAPCR